MPDIFSTPVWTSSTTYNKDAFVSNGGYVYYANDRHISTSNFNADVTNGHWVGTIDIDGVKKPYFQWRASYGYNFNIKPVVRNIKMGDGYEQILADGINNILLPFDVSFEDRGIDEYAAILHFFQNRAGVEKFYMILPSPFGTIKKFICSEWNATQTFYDKYTITAKIEEKI